MTDTTELDAAWDEWMAGKWNGIRAGELKAGMKMRDAEGGEAEITSVYSSADDCVFVEAKGRTGVHILKTKIAMIRPTK